MKHFLGTVFAIIIGTMCLVSAPSARAASDCSTIRALADWGENSTAHVAVAPGESCQFAIQLRGTVNSSKISQKPQRGRLKKVNLSIYEYTAKAKYKGGDTFAITATGQGEKHSGTSVITVQVTIE